jgi:hypothetical protein
MFLATLQTLGLKSAHPSESISVRKVWSALYRLVANIDRPCCGDRNRSAQPSYSELAGAPVSVVGLGLRGWLAGWHRMLHSLTGMGVGALFFGIACWIGGWVPQGAEGSTEAEGEWAVAAQRRILRAATSGAALEQCQGDRGVGGTRATHHRQESWSSTKALIHLLRQVSRLTLFPLQIDGGPHTSKRNPVMPRLLLDLPMPERRRGECFNWGVAFRGLAAVDARQPLGPGRAQYDLAA